MAELKFTIPDNRMADLVDAWGSGYSATVLDEDGAEQPNPQTKQQFAKEQIKLTIIQGIKSHEVRQLPDFPIT